MHLARGLQINICVHLFRFLSESESNSAKCCWNCRIGGEESPFHFIFLTTASLPPQNLSALDFLIRSDRFSLLLKVCAHLLSVFFVFVIVWFFVPICDFPLLHSFWVNLIPLIFLMIAFGLFAGTYAYYFWLIVPELRPCKRWVCWIWGALACWINSITLVFSNVYSYL